MSNPIFRPPLITRIWRIRDPNGVAIASQGRVHGNLSIVVAPTATIFRQAVLSRHSRPRGRAEAPGFVGANLLGSTLSGAASTAAQPLTLIIAT